MDMNDKDFDVIDNAMKQYFKDGKITEKCTKCGKTLVYEKTGNAFVIKCPNECISDKFRMI